MRYYECLDTLRLTNEARTRIIERMGLIAGPTKEDEMDWRVDEKLQRMLPKTREYKKAMERLANTSGVNNEMVLFLLLSLIEMCDKNLVLRSFVAELEDRETEHYDT